MPDHLPEKARPTCLLAGRESEAGLSICLARVNKNGRLSSSSVELTVAGSIPASLFRRVSACISGHQVVHRAEHRALDALAAAIPEGVPIHDAGQIAVSIPFPSRVPDAPSLDDLAAMRRLPDSLRAAATSCARSRLEILHQIWVHAIVPSLSYLGSDRAISAASRPAIALAASDEQGFPLPAPGIAGRPMPEDGWRTDPWTPEEILDCARRFAGGASLETISDLTARSPRAIRARLIIEGFLIHD